MGDLSKHFSRHEFQCFCGCGMDTVDHALIEVLEKIRCYFDAPVWITPKGGNRCPTANRAAGGAEYSQHMLSKAADIEVDGVPPEEVQRYCDTIGVPGLGRYTTFTHVDVRDSIARWTIS